jgi:hypothetical protein
MQGKENLLSRWMRKKDKDTTENLVKLHLRAIYLLKLIVIELMLLLSINFFLTAKNQYFFASDCHRVSGRLWSISGSWNDSWI